MHPSEDKAESSEVTRAVSIVSPQEKLEEAVRTMDAGVREDMRHQLKSLSPAEIADLLESTPSKLRVAIMELVRTEETFASILPQLDADVRGSLLQDMDIQDLASAGHDLATDDFADILQQLPETITDQVLARMDARDRLRLEKVLSYPEDTAGGLMNTDTITVRPRHSLALVWRYLRQYEQLPKTTDSLVVVNSEDEYLGLLPINKILTSPQNLTVQEVMETQQAPIESLLNQREIAQIFARDDLISAPIIDDAGKLVGRITIDDIVDVIIEDADQSLLGLSGVDVEQDTFAPLPKTMRSRGLWLGINLLTALIAAAVISIFEGTIAEVVSLAVLLPVVASMGGVAGTQTLTLIVRGMAINHVIPANLRWVIGRELLVGLMNGLLWAFIIAGLVTLIFQNVQLGIAVGTSVVITLFMAAFAGVTLPYFLNKLNIDPAIAGCVILTTITDVAGFLSFLGIATLLFL